MRPPQHLAYRAARLLTALTLTVALVGLVVHSATSTRQQGHRHVGWLPAAALAPTAPLLERTKWTAWASSEELTKEKAAAGSAIDGMTSTYWHSQWSTATPLPQWITVDMHATQQVSALRYEPRTGNPGGRIGRFEVSVSADARTWSAPVATGTWADDGLAKTISFATVTTRYVRLTALSEAGGRGPWVQAGEINLLGAPVTQTVDSSKAGSWSSVVGFPLVPAAVALLPGNRVLLWSAQWTNDYLNGRGRTETAILDLNTNTVSQKLVTNTGHDMFCPGVAILPDGRILVTGGNNAARTSIYDPIQNAWLPGPDMVTPRGYHGQTLLPNGEVFTIGGSWSGPVGGKTGEVWSPTGGWRALSGVPGERVNTADPRGTYRADNHAWLFPVSGGRLLHAGPSRWMHWISTTGNGAIWGAGARADSADAMNGTAVYYDVDKILTMGGATAYENAPATNRAYTIDVSGATPVVQRVGDMARAAAFNNSVVLPDGKVLTFGGQARPAPFTDTDAVMAPELWNPATGTFSTMANHALPRTYHSWAILLPDGRVLSGGGGLCGNCTTNHPDAQIFTPPYLLDANGGTRPRPRITAAPTAAAPGSRISVSTDSPVTRFALVRYGEATHSVNNNQRRVPVTIASSAGNTHQLQLPADRGVVLPGPYMLFALDAAGVPSVSTTIRIG